MSNILHLGVIPSEEDFQRAAQKGGRGGRWGGGGEATVICKGFTNLLNQIWGICTFVLRSLDNQS